MPADNAGSSNSNKEIPVFRPTWDEFKDFNKYIDYIETQGAHHVGLAKIIPPKEWVPRRRGYSKIDKVISEPIVQHISGAAGRYQYEGSTYKEVSVADFKELANSEKYAPPSSTSHEDLEHKYWKNLTFNPPIYGADVSGSITDKTQHAWNIQSLGSILDLLNGDRDLQAVPSGVSIAGVNTPYLYFGMWRSTFAWHTEDMDLYSINYVHCGAPKTWYCVPPAHGKRFERCLAGFYPELSQQCSSFMRHKTVILSPSVLKNQFIPVQKITQEAGEIMITFPYSYHSGFNHGFNCAESTNFATERWIEYGKRCTQCDCGNRREMVKFSMDAFVQKYQPQWYSLWMLGEDRASHPHDVGGKLLPASGVKYETSPVRSKAVKRLSPPGVGSRSPKKLLKSRLSCGTCSGCLSSACNTCKYCRGKSNEDGTPIKLCIMKKCTNMPTRKKLQRSRSLSPKKSVSSVAANRLDDRPMPKLIREIHCTECVQSFQHFSELYEHMKNGHDNPAQSESIDHGKLPVLRLESTKNAEGPGQKTIENQISFRIKSARGPRKVYKPRAPVIRKNKTNRLQVRKSKSSVHMCLKCSKTFISEHNLNRHQKKDCSSGSRKRTDSYICSVCDKQYNSYTGYALHLTLHDLNTAMRTGQSERLYRGLKCVGCCATFQSQKQYLSHLKSSCNPGNKDQNHMKTGWNPAKKDRHYVKMDGNPRKNGQHSVKERRKTMKMDLNKCEVQPQKGRTQKVAERSKRKSCITGLAIVGLVGGAASGRCCEVCHKSLPSQRQYHKHLLIQHPSSGTFSCNLCTRSFTLECLLREHQTYVHGAADRHRCHGCATEFACFGTWKAHVGLCPLVINGGSGHAAQQEPAPLPQYQCGVCNDRLDTMKKLLVHINLHLPKIMSDDAQPQAQIKAAATTAQVFAPAVVAASPVVADSPSTTTAATPGGAVVQQLTQVATSQAVTQAALWQTTNVQTVEAAAQYSAAYLHHTGAYIGAVHPHGTTTIQAPATATIQAQATTTASEQPTYWPATVTVDSTGAGAGTATTTIPYQEFINQVTLAQQQQQKAQQAAGQVAAQPVVSQQAQLAQHALFNYTATADGTLPLLDRSIMEPLLQSAPVVRGKTPGGTMLAAPGTVLAAPLLSPAPMTGTLPPASSVINVGQNRIILGTPTAIPAAATIQHHAPGSGSATPTPAPQPIAIIQQSLMEAQAQTTEEVLSETATPPQPVGTVVTQQSAATYYECSGCERLFTRVEALIDHHQSNHGVLPFQCCFCDTRYDTPGALDQHLPTCVMDRQQLPPMVFRCGRCWVAFGTALELMSHAQSCPLLPAHQQQALLAASAAASNATAAMFSPLKVVPIHMQSGNILNHQAVHQIIKTDPSKKVLDDSQDYVSESSPSLSTPQSARSCYHCGKNFKRSSYLKAHLRRHEEWDAEAARTQQENAVATAAGILPDEGALDHPCRLCGRRFQTRHSLVLHHARRHTPRPYRCVDCGRRFINASNLRIHRRTHSGEVLQFECICGKSFAWKTALMSHRKRCRSINGAMDIPQSIQEDTNPVELIHHKLEHTEQITHQVVEMQPVPPSLTPQPLAPLSSALAITTSAASTVNAASIQQADVIATSTNVWMGAQNGAQEIPAPPDAKPISDVLWGSNYEVEQPNTSDFACRVCGKGFKKMLYLKAHLRRHEEWDAAAAKTQQAQAVASATGTLQPDTMSDHDCRICGREFATRHSLVLHHARRHTPRPYRCNDCGKRFINASNLRIHRQMHTGERLQYECPCGKSFAWKTALMSHRKRCQHINGVVAPAPQVVQAKRKRAPHSASTVDMEGLQTDLQNDVVASAVEHVWLTPQNDVDTPKQDAKRLTEVFWAGNFELNQRRDETVVSHY